MITKVRKAEKGDLGELCAIYERARVKMRESGNMEQWTGEYPDRQTLKDDITRGELFVLVNADTDKILAVFAFIGGEDPTYTEIEDGQWPDDEPYFTIHRCASSGALPHAADRVFDWALEQCGNVRIDTHADNVLMLAALKRNGFTRCGIIHLADGAPRTAFCRKRER